MGADATSIFSDTFFLVGNANVCPLPPDRTFSNIGFSTVEHHSNATIEVNDYQQSTVDNIVALRDVCDKSNYTHWQPVAAWPIASMPES